MSTKLDLSAILDIMDIGKEDVLKQTSAMAIVTGNIVSGGSGSWVVSVDSQNVKATATQSDVYEAGAAVKILRVTSDKQSLYHILCLSATTIELSYNSQSSVSYAKDNVLDSGLTFENSTLLAAIAKNGCFGLSVEVNYHTNTENKDFGFDVSFLYKHGEDEFTYITKFNVDKMLGQPFNAKGKYITQTFEESLPVFDNNYKLTKITVIPINKDFFDYRGLISQKNDTVELYAVTKTVQSKNRYELELADELRTEVLQDSKDTYTLVAKLYRDGVEFENTAVEYYWFKENAAVEANSGNRLYSVYGGEGWELLNAVKESKTETINESDIQVVTFKTASNKCEIGPAVANAYDNNFKCVAVYGDIKCESEKKNIQNLTKNGLEIVPKVDITEINNDNKNSTITLSAAIYDPEDTEDPKTDYSGYYDFTWYLRGSPNGVVTMLESNKIEKAADQIFEYGAVWCEVTKKSGVTDSVAILLPLTSKSDEVQIIDKTDTFVEYKTYYYIATKYTPLSTVEQTPPFDAKKYMNKKLDDVIEGDLVSEWEPDPPSANNENVYIYTAIIQVRGGIIVSDWAISLYSVYGDTNVLPQQTITFNELTQNGEKRGLYYSSKNKYIIPNDKETKRADRIYYNAITEDSTTKPRSYKLNELGIYPAKEVTADEGLILSKDKIYFEFINCIKTGVDFSYDYCQKILGTGNNKLEKGKFYKEYDSDNDPTYIVAFKIEDGVVSSTEAYAFVGDKLYPQMDYYRFINTADPEADYCSDDDQLYINADYINAGTLRVGNAGQEKFFASLNANDVKIGGFSVDEDSISHGSPDEDLLSNSEDTGYVYMGSNGIQLGDKFAVDSNGSIQGFDLEIKNSDNKVLLSTKTGQNIAAVKIGGFTVTENTFQSSQVEDGNNNKTNIIISSESSNEENENIKFGNHIAFSSGTGSARTYDITSKTITSDNITSGNITSDSIASGNITSGNITSGNITSDSIASGNITSGNITSNNLYFNETVCLSSGTAGGTEILTYKTTLGFYIENKEEGTINWFGGVSKDGKVDIIVYYKERTCYDSAGKKVESLSASNGDNYKATKIAAIKSFPTTTYNFDVVYTQYSGLNGEYEEGGTKKTYSVTINGSSEQGTPQYAKKSIAQAVSHNLTGYKFQPSQGEYNPTNISSTTITSYGQQNIAISAVRINTNFLPQESTSYTLGSSSLKWKDIYGNNVYYDTLSINSSDANKKNSITHFSTQHDQLFDSLNPVTFKFNDGESGRTHMGLIAQDVKAAIEDVGLTTQDVAAYCEWEEGVGTTCGIRYGELIPLNIYEIQQLKRRVAEQEELITQMAETLNLLKEKLKEE